MTPDRLFGPAFPQLGWVPAPRYLMRRARILEMTRDLTPGRLLEAGPGAGTLLIEHARRGFQSEGLEPSDAARTMARGIIAASGQSIPVHDRVQDDWHEAFDYVCAFDVLEHIEDDASALASWKSWLKPGGSLLLSVPARMKLWTAGDEWAGHYRRYEKEQLLELVAKCGLRIEAFECYGFPLTNLTERLSARTYRKLIVRSAGSAEMDRQANNDRSGVDRRPHLRIYPLLNSVPGRLALRSFLAVQDLFLGKDWGSGYLLRASKPLPPSAT